MPNAIPAHKPKILPTKVTHERPSDERRTLPLDGGAWRKLRRVVLKEQPLCLECLWFGDVREATQVDHINNDSGDNRRGNLAGLCRHHHSKKTRIEMSGDVYMFPYVAAYNTPKPIADVTIVCGAPGSGKSTYVDEMAKDGDRVIDLDRILDNASFPYETTEQGRLLQALEERNRQLGELSTFDGKAWFIVSAPTQAQRKWWQEMLGGDVVLLDTPESECVARIKATRIGKRLERSILACISWHNSFSIDQQKNHQQPAATRRAPRNAHASAETSQRA